MLTKPAALPPSDAELWERLQTYPDIVADKKEAYGLAVEEERRLRGRRYLDFKAQFIDKKTTEKFLEALVDTDDELYKFRLEVVKLRVNVERYEERYLAAKIMARMRVNI